MTFAPQFVQKTIPAISNFGFTKKVNGLNDEFRATLSWSNVSAHNF